MTVDTEGPRFAGQIAVDSELPIGSHQDDVTEVTFSWLPPTDGSGTVQMRYLAGNNPPESANPTFEIYGTSFTDEINEIADFYANFAADDETDNRTKVDFGPWHGGQLYGGGWGSTAQSFDNTIDGYLDIEHNEWLTATEWLDDDNRPIKTQSLYSTWDGIRTYVGWKGANWDNDGSLWLYWDISTGGTDVPVTGTLTLPFQADRAIQVVDNGTIQGWEYIGASWVAESRYIEVQHDERSNGSEVDYHIHEEFPGNTGSYDNHRFMAYAVDDSGAVWTSFPTNNDLSGDFDYFYDWDITTGTDLLKLPKTSQLPFVEMVTVSEPPPQDTLSNNSLVEYLVTLTNLERRDADNVQILLEGTSGVNYQTVSGAVCSNCAANDYWLLDVPTIASGASQAITVTAQMDSDLGLLGVSAVTTTIQLTTEVPLLQQETVVHALDLAAPEVVVLANPGHALGAGLQSILGVAGDGMGTGVALVETSTDGSNWQTADGTQSWGSDHIIPESFAPAATWQLYVRATDYHGQTSSIEMITFEVDTVAPLITPTVPAVLGNSLVGIFSGAALDPDPIDAQVASLEIQRDSENWDLGTLYAPDSNGEHLWSSI